MEAAEAHAYTIDEKKKAESDHDSDLDLDGMDDEEESIMRQMMEQRIAAAKAKKNADQEMKILGHGEYTEILE